MLISIGRKAGNAHNETKLSPTWQRISYLENPNFEYAGCRFDLTGPGFRCQGDEFVIDDPEHGPTVYMLDPIDSISAINMT